MSVGQLHLDVVVPAKRSGAAKFAAELESLRSSDLLDAKAVAAKAATLFGLVFNERPKKQRYSFERERGKRKCRSLGRRFAIAAYNPQCERRQGLLANQLPTDASAEIRRVAAVLVEIYQPLFGGCDLAALIGLKEE